jgi:hypothetical protein
LQLITQQWLSVAGLGLDLIGFALLLREWWIAFFNEGHQIELEEQRERMLALRNMRPAPAPGQQNPFAAIERMQDEQAMRKARAAHRSAMMARKGTFILATVLVIAGYLLQIAGAWPGCCSPWVAPQF